MDGPWMDLTLRAVRDAEVEVQPDNTVELSFPLGDDSRATLLIPPDLAKRLNERLGELLMLIPIAIAAVHFS